MKRLTEGYLLGVLEDFEHTQGGPLPTESSKCYLLAADALCQYVSPEWTRSNVFALAEMEAFLRPWPTAPPDTFKHADRVIALAEMLFNLQDVEGIGGRIRQLRHGSVEATVAELEGAKLLFQSECSVRFVTASGQTGSDYDLTLTLRDGSAVGCELKCKIETTRPSLGTLFDTIEHASIQLPCDRPTAVFIKIPEAWPHDPGLPGVVSQALSQAADLSNAPGLVVFHWEEWAPLPNGGMARAVLYRPEANPAAPRYHPALSQLVRPAGRWRYFLEVIRRDGRP